MIVKLVDKGLGMGYGNCYVVAFWKHMRLSNWSK